MRLKLFNDIIRIAIDSSDHEGDIDINSNLSCIVMFILAKDFSDRTLFKHVFIDNLNDIITKFISTFDN